MPKQLTIEKYSKCKSWKDKFDGKNVKLKIPKNSWKKPFNSLIDPKNNEIKELDKINTHLTKKKNEIIHPNHKYVFYAFKLTPFENVKVVFIGQDPYFNCETFNGSKVSQAMGLSFSVPIGCPVPSSLKNIYNNLLKYKHIDTLPTHGNLENWANQGCLMLNTSLTVINGQKESHCKIWSKFTSHIIQYISDNLTNVVFVLWGNHALNKLNLIDLDTHETVISSHPSGLSANKKMGMYNAFVDIDHFGDINKLLIKFNKEPIIWKI
jgi:uracil-DNA glycosylase